MPNTIIHVDVLPATVADAERLARERAGPNADVEAFTFVDQARKACVFDGAAGFCPTAPPPAAAKPTRQGIVDHYAMMRALNPAAEHERLRNAELEALRRHAELQQRRGEPGDPPALDPHTKRSAAEYMTIEEKAVGILVRHPDWTVTQIAKSIGCARQTLYRCPLFVAAREFLKGAKSEYPHGTYDAKSGAIEAYDR